MKNLKIVAIIVLIISFGFTAMSQQKIYKIKPIKGKKSALVQSQDLGTGMTKWSVSLERLSGQSSDIYLPSDALVLAEGSGYNPPNPSNSMNINSAKTADGFLFNAKGPKNNNIQIHLKKSASSNSSYTLEVNLRQGEKYEFPIYYLPNQYLMVRGSASDYANMVSSISSNQYFLESLSYVDDELAKYASEPNLIWWAEAFVGVFQDYVDVEAIGQIVPGVNFNVYSFESQTPGSTMFVWKCGEERWLIPIDQGNFIIINSQQSCATVSGIVKPRTTLCHFFYCPPPWDSEYDSCIAKCESDPYPINVGVSCETICQQMYDIDGDYGQYVACRDACRHD